MIKRTLYFGNPAYLKTANEQLIIEMHDSGETQPVPIEDIGILILDNTQITITQVLISKLLANNTALITCDHTHHPVGLMLNLDGNNLQSQKFKVQIDASVPLKKQLWQQTVAQKIYNQAMVLKSQRAENKLLLNLSKEVKSGDSENLEGQAAAYYWKHVFPDFLEFRRERYGANPNNLLNYGYALLRAMVARSLVGSGLLPTLGIHHRNQYNAYCLADDIMEPYRPYVDLVVCGIIRQNGKFLEMTPSMKKELLKIPQLDVKINGQKSPMLMAIQRTTASLAKCFEGLSKKIIYPVME
ncbi:type II CRISPR-associated endonuclease Cas1 [Parasegetibacter sp. NRK P23]|uniref:type II CRISPR-associated endonuclease Cas1 n=1 Tax=Parasegetibacter sp. NRK P23 TaxID=2942999 RepID=UPI00204493C7|nr:type II CRISPR-associated endonuclease Cas1 [Parasegetibacter sp. NRK P23]MCM5527092.1 type II CRISPR-associated endonuclease Cas1 [Parasegetibacter sp. NRK P23]